MNSQKITLYLDICVFVSFSVITEWLRPDVFMFISYKYSFQRTLSFWVIESYFAWYLLFSTLSAPSPFDLDFRLVGLSVAKLRNELCSHLLFYTLRARLSLAHWLKTIYIFFYWLTHNLLYYYCVLVINPFFLSRFSPLHWITQFFHVTTT